MSNKLELRRIIFLILLIGLGISFSFLTNKFWGTNQESKSNNDKLLITEKMTISEFGKLNNIPNSVLVKIFDLKGISDTTKQICITGFGEKIVLKRAKVELSEYQEENSQNPFRYTIHFILALICMGLAFYLIIRAKITPKIRIYLYVGSIVIFGLGFNSNPSPMGPVKDTITLFGNFSEILHPRLLAILTYLILVVLANKFICSWVCQVGVLQDLIFRLFRDSKDRESFIKQYKIPFVVSNSIRFSFLLITTIISYIWALNIIESINPFNIFNPTEISIIGCTFILLLLILSIFVYRPWCYLFCPFGFLSWLFEKFSIYKIRVNHQTCTSCYICIKSCPSDAMKGILEKRSIVPDCFSCGACISECPENSITFSNKIFKCDYE
jgi:Pyruvate/2-oxoacid:ferredoxin oxidoreductase delta subunit